MSEEKEEKGKKIISTQKYLITIEVCENGERLLSRKNDGFSPIELMGLCEQIQLEIIEQLRGCLPQPTKVSRELVVDEFEIDEKEVADDAR